MTRIILASWAILSAIFLASVTIAGTYQVTFTTTGCNGDTGYATVEIDRIYKIETISCEGPDAKFKKLKQVIVKSVILPTSFDLFTVTEKEAQRIKKELDSYMKARKGLLERGQPLIIHKE